MTKKLNKEQLNKIFEQMLEEEFNKEIKQNKKQETIINMFKQHMPLPIISQKTNIPIKQVIVYYEDYMKNSFQDNTFTKHK